MTKFASNYAPDEPVDDTRPLLALDDRQLAIEVRDGPRKASAIVEMHRRRFEAAWSGPWSSGDAAKVTRPHSQPSVSREAMRRNEFVKLCHQSHSPNKAERNAAKYLLKTCYGKSVV